MTQGFWPEQLKFGVEWSSVEKGKAEVEVEESDREFHFGHMDSFSKHPNGGVKWAVVYPSWV